MSLYFLCPPSLCISREGAKVCAGQRGLRTVSPPTLPSKVLSHSGDNFLLLPLPQDHRAGMSKNPQCTETYICTKQLQGELLKSLCHCSVMLLKLPLPQISVWGLWCSVFKQQCLTVINSSAMEALRALLALISVSLLTQESPCFPTGWQFQGDPTWEEASAPVIFQRGKEASPRIPGALAGVGVRGSSKNLRPPGKLFLPGWLSLTCDPSSQLRTVPVPAVPRTPGGTLPGPKLQQLWLRLPDGKR